jgi:hypothetical protein
MSEEVKKVTRAKKTPPDISKYEFVSKVTDTGLTDEELVQLQDERQSTVTQHLEFLNEADATISSVITLAYEWMKHPETNPHRGIRLPADTYSTSIKDLLKLQTKAYDAYASYGEILASARAVLSIRKLLADNRKNKASINEGSTEVERKALSSIRSFPEEVLLAEIEALISWAETRYYISHMLIQTINQLVTQKSIEKTNADKSS